MQIFKKGTAVLTASIMLFSSFVGTNSNLSIKAETSTNEPTTIKGDYDSNGKITALDLSAMIQFILGKTNFDSTKFDLMDMDNDGNINIIDLILLKSIALGKEINVASSQIAAYNNIAKQIFVTAQTILQDYEMAGKDLPYDNIYEFSEDDQSEFSIELRENINLKQGAKFAISFDDYIVKSVFYTDPDSNFSGAYPNMISQKLNIPYPSPTSSSYNSLYGYLKYASSPSYNWEELCSEFISKDPKQASLPYYPDITVSEANDIAKKIFATAQAIIQDYETAGKPFSYNFYEFREYDSNQFSYDLREEIYLKSGARFAISFDGYNVKSVFYSDPNSICSGAYPNMISQKLNIPYPNNSSDGSLDNYLNNAYNPSFNWEESFPEFISKDPAQASLPYYPEQTAVAPKTTNAIANATSKTIFTIAQSILQDYETAGKPLPFENNIYEYKQDDNNEFFNELNQNVNLKQGSNFAILVDGYTVKGVFYSDTTPNCFGAYPNTIPKNIHLNIDASAPYANYLNYASDENFDWNTLK